MNDDNKGNRTFTEEFEIAGHQLIERIKQLIADGNVRTLRIKTESGDTFLEIPLTAGAIAGGVVVLAAPWLAAIGGIAALATRVKIEIVRNTEDEGDQPPGPDTPDNQ
jgi:phage terminase large subunit-like protein